MLDVQNIVTGYGKAIIVQGISLKIEKNELVTIIGPNGSGKSTMLKAIAGLLPVMSGRILFNEQNIANMYSPSLAKLGIGFVPQLENIFPNLTVFENIEMGALLNVKANFDKNYSRVVNIFPILEERFDMRAKKLSGGERQMLALARCLMAEPKIMLLDEPTAALSPLLASEILKIVKYLKDKEGIPILLVEQNARKSLEISDRAYVLASGRVIRSGNASEILQDPNIGKIFLGEVKGQVKAAKSTLQVLFSAFDFHLGPVSLLNYPPLLKDDEKAKISFISQTIASKLREKKEKSEQSETSVLGVFLPFESFNLVGYVYIFNIESELQYTKELALGALTFLVEEASEVSFFSLLSEIDIVGASIASFIQSNIKYKGDATDLSEFRPILEKNLLKLSNRLEKRILDLEVDIVQLNLHPKLYKFISQTQKGLANILYCLLVDPNQKILVYSSNEQNLLGALECMQILAPHRVINVEIAGKTKSARLPSIMATTNTHFVKAVEAHFGTIINLDTGQIKSISVNNRFLTDLANVMISNKNVPELFNQVITFQIRSELLGTVGKIIRASGALSDEEKVNSLKKIAEKHDKSLLQIAMILGVYYNPFLDDALLYQTLKIDKGL